jgi:hypothetical protein
VEGSKVIRAQAEPGNILRMLGNSYLYDDRTRGLLLLPYGPMEISGQGQLAHGMVGAGWSF